MALSRKYYQGLAEALAKPTERYGSGALAQRLVPIVATVQAVADMTGLTAKDSTMLLSKR